MRKMLFLATTILAAALYSASANAEQKEVTVWSWFVQSTMEKSIAAFEKAHPDIKVKYTYYNYSPEYITALKAAAASGSLPDVIGLQPGSLTQQYRANLEAVNERAAKQWGDKWADKVFPVNRKQMLMGSFELRIGLDLKPEMVDAGGSAPLRDREVDARIIEHPFGVIVLAHRRLDTEQRRIEADALGQIGDCDVNVKAFHAALLLTWMARAARVVGLVAARRGLRFGMQSGAHAESPASLARQQFSVR